MTENTQPPITGEMQQSLEVSQSSQAEGNVDQGSSQGLPPPVPPIPNQSPPNGYQPQAGNEKHNRLDIARLIVEILTLLVLLWYTIITNGLWGVADQANRLNIGNSRLDQQAWIGVNQMRLSKVPTTNEQLIVNITLSNSGKTPALYVVNRIKFTSEKPQSLDSFSFTLPKVQSRVSPPGGYGYSTALTIFQDGPLSGLLSAQEVASIERGELPLYVYGTITYKDIFGEPHLIRLCGIYTYNTVDLTAFRWCEEKDYNYME